MTRRIIRTDEAEWEGVSRVWAHIQLYDPRRGSLKGHLIAAAVGFGIGLLITAAGL